VTTKARLSFHHPSLSLGQSVWILGGAAVLLSLGMGMRQSLGLFMRPITQETGITASDYAFALAIQNIVWGVTQPFIGALIDRYGTRWIALGGAFIYAGGLMLTATATDTLAVTLGAGVLIGIALSCTTSAVAAKVAARTVRAERRSLAFGIVSAAGSIGTFFAAPLAQGVIASDGWRMALYAFVALTAAMVPAAFIGSRADAIPVGTTGSGGSQQSLREALIEARGHSGYVVMALAFFVCGLQLVFLTTHLPTYLAICGVDAMVGAQALATIGAFNVAGSWLFGWLGDRYPKRYLLGFIYLLRSALIAAYFLMPPSQLSTLLFAAAMGLLWLGVVPLVNGLVTEIFGVKFLATLTGVAFFSHQVGSFLGAWAGGWIYDALGSYDLAWRLAVLIGVLAGAIQLFMNDRPTPRIAAVTATA
jgi:predicted MFS family arabinose efflux permease